LIISTNSDHEQELSGLLEMLREVIKQRINVVLIFGQQTITPTFYITFVFIAHILKFLGALVLENLECKAGLKEDVKLGIVLHV
jgi:hypothetical protein